MLGVEMDSDDISRAKATVEATAEGNRRRKEKLRQARELEELSDADWNADFGYIAGHTSGGVPYGVTWEELGETPPWSEGDEVPVDGRPGKKR